MRIMCCKCGASVLQCVAVFYSLLQCAAACCNFVAETALDAHNVLQVCCKCVVVCRSVWQFVQCVVQRITVCCRVS